MSVRMGLIHHTAACLNCSASVDMRNAKAWAEDHAKTHGHAVELQLGYRVSSNTPPVIKKQ